MKCKRFPLVLLLPLLVGCSFPSINNNPDDGGSTPGGGGETNHKEDVINSALSNSRTVFNSFFNYQSKVEIELEFTSEVLCKLQEYGEGEGNSNFLKNEMYHPCTAKITIDGNTNTYYEVGARIRGNTSRVTDFYKDGSFVDNKFAHLKLSFSQAFDDAKDNDYYVTKWDNVTNKNNRKDRKFGGMKKFDLKWNRNEDSSFTKEIYALDAFRNEGIYAQYSNLVNLTIKTETDSRTMVYQALESVDKRLLKRANSSDNSGDLYKCLWTDKGRADLTGYSNQIIGKEGQNYRPVYDLKTNEDTSNMSIIKTFIDHVKADHISGEEFYNDISNYLDVNYFLKYSALCWVMGLPDDLRNNYNNYYLYFNKDNKAIFIPYDNDRCLGIRNGWDKDLKNTPYDSDMAVGANERNASPIVRRFLSDMSSGYHPVHQASLEVFHQYCVEYAQRYLDTSKFQEFTNKFYYSSKDISGGNSNDSFETYATAKLNTLT